MTPETRIQAADTALNGLLQWGIGGAVLAVFVAPTFLWMARGALRRQQERDQRDDREREAQAARQDKLIDALVASVEQQKETMRELKERLRADEQASMAHAASQARMLELLDTISKRLAPGGPQA